jgi:pentatricopeptide repeat protein
LPSVPFRAVNDTGARYGAAEKHAEAVATFEKMKEAGIKPTLRSYVTLFDLLGRARQVKLLLR